MSSSDILYCIAALLNIIGFIGAVVPGIPGPPISFVGIILCCIASPSPLMILIVVLLGLDTIIVSILDYIAPGLLTNHAGGCKKAVWGANIGLIIGLFFSPWGLLIGPFIGAFLGEIINSSSNWKTSLQVSAYTLLSLFVGTFFKFILCSIIMIACIINCIDYYIN